MTKQDKLSALTTEKDNSTFEDIKKRIENRAWLQRSKAIALKILMRIDELNITQKKLAENMGVSAQLINKWVKGKENFTLETISKLEKHLGIKLIELANTNLMEEIKYDESFNNSLMEEIHSETKIIPFKSEFSSESNEYNTAV